MDGQVWTTELRRRRNRRSIRLDRVVIITDQSRVPPRKKKTVDRDRIYDAAMRRTKKGIGSWTMARPARNKSLTRRFRENAYGADNFEFRSHDPTMSGCRRGISQTRTLSYESSKWSRRRMNLGKVRHLKLQSAYELPENVNSVLHREKPFFLLIKPSNHRISHSGNLLEIVISRESDLERI